MTSSQFYTAMSLDLITSQYLELLGNSGNVESYQVLNDLRRCVDFFLCESTQCDKYSDSLLFSSIIESSAERCVEFSGKSAAQCFEVLERIAQNLILFKWRRVNEYANISQHTPVYQYKLKQTLYGFEKVLINMGYRLISDECVWRLDSTNETKISVQYLVQIAVDCFVCSLECQIIQTMKSLTKGKNVSWSKIVSCRKSMIGSAETCVKSLITEFGLSNFHDNFDTGVLKKQTNISDVLKNGNSSYLNNPTVNERKSKTTWYTTDAAAVVENATRPRLAVKLSPIPKTEPHSSAANYKSSTLPSNNVKRNVPSSLPRLDFQTNLVSKMSSDQNLIRHRSPSRITNGHVSPSPTNGYETNKVRTPSTSSDVNFLHSKVVEEIDAKVKSLFKEAASIPTPKKIPPAKSPSPLPNQQNESGGRSCPKCRMLNSRKDILLCSFCSYYFPI